MGRHLPLLDQLIAHVDDHDRTSCDDRLENGIPHFDSGHPRCSRCGLLYAKSKGLVLGKDYWLDVDIRFIKR